VLAWRDEGRRQCGSKDADPNTAALTGGCRYFGRAHHTTQGGAFTVADDPALQK